MASFNRHAYQQTNGTSFPAFKDPFCKGINRSVPDPISANGQSLGLVNTRVDHLLNLLVMIDKSLLVILLSHEAHSLELIL